MASIPFLIPLIALLTGMALAFSGAGLISGSLLIGVGTISGVIFTKLSEKPLLAFRYRKFNYFWIAIILIGVGVISTDLNRPEEFKPEVLDKVVGFRGEIVEKKITTTGDRLSVRLAELYLLDNSTIKVANAKALVKVLPFTDAVTGDYVSFGCGLRELESNSGHHSDVFNEYLMRKGINYSGLCQDEDLTIDNQGATWRYFSSGLRDKIVEKIELSGLKRPTVDFLVTILTGDKDFLDNNTKTVFADAGVSHALALSGMHIGILVSILLFLLFPFNIYGKYKYRLFITLVFVWVFTFITGMSPSAVRASVMVSFLFISFILERKNNIFNSIFGAAFIILVFNPYAIMDIGFQLSFSCVMLIAAFVNPLNPIKRHKKPVVYSVYSFILTTVVVSLGIWALSAYYFHSVPLMILPANMLILPLLPIYLFVSLIFITISSFGKIIPFIGETLDRLYDSLLNSLNLISGGGSSVLTVHVHETVVILWLIAVLITGVFLQVKKIKKKFFALPATIGILSIIFIFIIPGERSEDEMIFQKRYDRITISVYENEINRIIQPPVNSITSYLIKDKHIISVDTKIPDSLDTICDFVVVGNGYKGDLERIISQLKPSVVILHPSLFRKREKLIEELCEKNKLKCHSLRNSGAMRVSLKK